jgi:hypothetical protein
MANKLPDTAFGRLVRQLKKIPMTRKEITIFLLKEKGDTYFYGRNHDYYNSSLYGTSTREGLLERFGKRLRDGRWTTNSRATTEGPFVPLR